MIIEFFGFPGSGKTTICNKFVKKIQKDNKDVIRGTFDHLEVRKRVLFKLFYSFISFFINPKFFAKNLYFFVCSKANYKTKVTDFINLTYLYARYFTFRNSNKIVVFDQGLLQAYWSVLTFSSNELLEYDNSILFKYIDKVIVLEIDWEQNLERLFSREDQRSRVQRQVSEMEFHYGKFLEVKESLNELKIPYTIYLNSSKNVKKNVKKIKRKINFSQYD